MLFTNFKTIFGLDLRSLAFFRIGLGLVIIVDLIHRSRDLRAHYTDFGIFPRSEFFESFTFLYSPIHTLGGTTEFQGFLFLLTGIFALLLIFGYKTRVVTVVVWLLVHSMVYRNTNIIYRGDLFLCLLTFWSMFLPLGARFSIDSALNTSTKTIGHHYFTVASFALTLQIGLIYLFAGIMKFGPDWLNGSGVYYTLHDQTRTSGLSSLLIDKPKIMEFLTFFVLYIEKLSPILLFSPLLHVPLRMLGLASLIIMHLGFILFINIGLFPYICFVTLSVLTPGWFWDKISTKVFSEDRKNIKIYFDGDCVFCKKVCLIFKTLLLLPVQISIEPAQNNSKMNKLMELHYSWVVVGNDGVARLRWDAVIWLIKQSPIFWPISYILNWGGARKIGDMLYTLISTNRVFLGKFTKYLLPYNSNNIYTPSKVAGVLIILITISITYQNINTFFPKLYQPRVIYNIHHILGLRQGWGFFAPNPPSQSIWLVIEGETNSGEKVDAYNMSLSEVSWDTPKNIGDTYKNYRWRKYLSHHMIYGSQYGTYLGTQLHNYNDYLCRVWNEKFSNDQKLTALTISSISRKTQPDYKPFTFTTKKLYEGECLN